MTESYWVKGCQIHWVKGRQCHWLKGARIINVFKRDGARFDVARFNVDFKGD